MCCIVPLSGIPTLTEERPGTEDRPGTPAMCVWKSPEMNKKISNGHIVNEVSNSGSVEETTVNSYSKEQLTKDSVAKTNN